MQEAAVRTQLETYFARHGGDHVVCVYLFGSAGRGEARPHSDLDIAVLYRSEPPHTLEGTGVRLAGELERITGKPVDVVVMNRAPVDLVHRVLRDGVLVYEHDSLARVAFEVKSRSLYFDIQPILKRYRRGRTRAVDG